MVIRLSQAQLNLLETCPRKFQQVYLDQLGTPIAPEQQEQMNWGSQFHLLMQQRELGLPMLHHAATAADQPLQRCADAFIQAAPELFHQPAIFRQSEHRRTLEFQGYLLTVVYDLLILNPQQAQILDWKTYPRPQNQRWLAENWQTLLYPFVLAETSDYSPADISLTYWFVQVAQSAAESKPQNLRFNYTVGQHEAVRHRLTALLGQLTEWLAEYNTGRPFPQVEITANRCGSCVFDVRCQRSQGQNQEYDQRQNQSARQDEVIPANQLLSLDEIEEVAL